MLVKEKIWVDSTQIEKAGKIRLKELVADNNVLCTGTNFVDCVTFQENPDLTEEWLHQGKLVIEPTLSLNEMVAKEFYWSSSKQLTGKSKSFAQAIEKLPNKDAVEQLAKLFEQYKAARWTPGPLKAPIPIPYDSCERLGMDYGYDYKRTQLLQASKKHEAMYQSLNKLYVRSIALQHCCTAAIIDGKVERLKA